MSILKKPSKQNFSQNNHFIHFKTSCCCNLKKIDVLIFDKTWKPHFGSTLEPFGPNPPPPKKKKRFFSSATFQIRWHLLHVKNQTITTIISEKNLGQTVKQTNRKTDGVHFIGPQFVDLKWNTKNRKWLLLSVNNKNILKMTTICLRV